MNPSRITVGLGNDTRALYKVMKPPGGDSHDLFGAEFKGTPCHNRVMQPPGGTSSDIFSESSVSQPDGATPRRVKNHMVSNIFGGPLPSNENGHHNGNTQSRGKHVPDASFERLFGDAVSADDTPQTKGKGMRLKSQASKEDGASSPPPYGVSNGHSDGGDGLANGNGNHTPGGNGNPVTGNGYMDENEKDVKAPSKSRIPPGGYCTKLW